ncbi:MAG: hypothetical protein JSS07_06620 [Proteobacteria bacterium]|nr:hypothetical protein [Pseudomonadota bacterium]
MKKTEIIDIGFLFYPSMRALAYLNAFLNNHCLPKEIIILSNNISNDSVPFEQIQAEATRYGYDQQFFNTQILLQELIQNKNIKSFILDTHDINHDSVQNTLMQCDSPYFVFSGGGILQKDILSLNKKFIHIHPGKIPEFRGSTCFYYSLLDNFSLGTTSFIMAEKLDKGDVIYQYEHTINYPLQKQQLCFMDYILDPYIRAFNLSAILANYKKYKKIESRSQTTDQRQNYFVIHPLLRKLAANKISLKYDPLLPIGIHLKGQSC